MKSNIRVTTAEYQSVIFILSRVFIHVFQMYPKYPYSYTIGIYYSLGSLTTYTGKFQKSEFKQQKHDYLKVQGCEHLKDHSVYACVMCVIICTSVPVNRAIRVVR